MLTVEAARKIGINACIDKIGRDFMQTHRDNAVYAYGENEEENSVYCYVGADDKPYVSPYPDDVLVLDSETHFPYYASCNVSLEDGATTFIDYALPA